jgi:hypothetical protein
MRALGHLATRGDAEAIAAVSWVVDIFPEWELGQQVLTMLLEPPALLARLEVIHQKLAAIKALDDIVEKAGAHLACIGDEDVSRRRAAMPVSHQFADRVGRDVAPTHIISAIFACTVDKDLAVRHVAMQVLFKIVKIGHHSAMPFVCAALQAIRDFQDHTAAKQALDVLSRVSTKGNPLAIHVVAGFLEHRAYSIRWQAVKVLRLVAEPGHSGAIAAVSALFEVEHPGVRQSARQAMSIIS